LLARAYRAGPAPTAQPETTSTEAAK